MTVHDIDLQTLAGAAGQARRLRRQDDPRGERGFQVRPDPAVRGLQRLHDRFAEQGFTVAGFPCNQFGEQEPGTADEITEFCSVNYGVSFPMFAKIDVNGDRPDPLYTELTAVADSEGNAGDIQWNFEKFLVGKDGKVIARFRPLTDPEAPEIVEAIEASLAGEESLAQRWPKPERLVRRRFSACWRVLVRLAGGFPGSCRSRSASGKLDRAIRRQVSCTRNLSRTRPETLAHATTCPQQPKIA